MPRKQIALACQGGGSHTAFTAGVLTGLTRHLATTDEYTITALSGTSGGAICALLLWVELVRRGQSAPADELTARLRQFWRDLAPANPGEWWFNAGLVTTVRLQGQGALPTLNTSPYDPVVDLVKTAMPRPEFTNLGQLLQRVIPWEEIADRQTTATPRLLVGAVDVLRGTFKAFDSRKGEISLNAVVASTAVPTLFKAVTVGDSVYWDGLFSQNPPIRDLFAGLRDVSEKPDEVWVIRINQQTAPREPRTSREILDRQNELSGNISLIQEYLYVKSWNDLIAKVRRDEPNAELFLEILARVGHRKHVTWRDIAMAPAVVDQLDYASKLDRDPIFLQRL
ncbi:MAG: patatin-like phospholipase family protein, partial [Dehalococcoidia bacterium]|nr:patatin-like phospholipase family protein [Dehalococcoidia bacterium]